MDQANLQLSEEEMDLVTNAEWILTKNRIMQKAWLMLEQVQGRQSAILRYQAFALHGAVLDVPAKISKGENYQGLPYLVLDHPRIFGKKDVLAIRTLFWWGNFFSVTLQLSGTYKSSCQRACLNAFAGLRKEGFFVCVHDSEWEHHFEQANYLPLAGMEVEEFKSIILEKSFVKLAVAVPLTEWERAPDRLSACFELLVTTILAQGE